MRIKNQSAEYIILDQNELPPRVLESLHSHAKENEFRRSSFDVVLAYNSSDWTSGYMGTLGGFTAFFTIPGSSGELSHVPRAILTDGTSTRVIINQVHRKELGYPYGTCVKINNEHSDILNNIRGKNAPHQEGSGDEKEGKTKSRHDPYSHRGSKFSLFKIWPIFTEAISILKSDKQCMYECRMDAVIAMCGCTMPHYTIRS